ncbi:MAG TPA: CoA pyrophosphatase [Desulfuromonadales bacterium]|nr:CoA pyrophosphatase [Desulfuromonadales bacterium]
MPSLTDIRRRLANRQPCPLTPGSRRHAAVAMILREAAHGPEILFIERSRHESDPWSGDLGFPGGKIEADDDEPRRAAERETLEEIGLDLQQARYLGRLDDLAGAHLPVVISCFVYEIGQTVTFSLSDEVAEVFWVPLQTLLEPRRHRLTTVFFRGERLQRPAIDLRGPDRTVLWGITYRLVCQFLQILGLEPIPLEAVDERQG